MDIKQLKTTTSWSLVCLWLVLFSENVLAQDYSANMPAVYEEPGGVSARGADSSFGVESIDPFTGALKIVVTDLTIPSNGGLDLSVVRNYQSFVKLQGGLPTRTYQVGRTTTGIGWDLHFGRLWKAGADGVAPQLAATNTTNGCRVTNITSVNNPVLELPDGSRQLFAASNASETGYAYITNNRWILKCLPTSQDTHSNGGAIVISPEGIKYTFNFFHRVTTANVSSDVRDANSAAAYHVTKIEHPNGTSITITYLSKSLTYFATLDDAVHSEGQSVSFNYTGTNTPGGTSNTLHLESFSSSGQTWDFNYVTAVGSGVVSPGPYEYLDTVTRPDGRETQYDYVGLISSAATVSGQYCLKQVTTPLGGEVIYTYGESTFPTRDIGSAAGLKYVVTKKEVKRHAPASGGVFGSGGTDTWTYNYRPSTVSSNQSDFTDVRGPNSCVTYEHYVGQTAGTGWKVGSLLTQRIAAPGSGTSCSSSAARTTTYTWVADLVANQSSYRYPLLSDPATNAPRLSQQEITQDGRSYTTAYNDPDAFGNPQSVVETGVTRSSTGAAQSISRTTDYTYFTSTSDWILHRTKNETVDDAFPGIDYPIVRTFYTGSKVGLVQTEARAGVSTSYDYYTSATAGGSLFTATDANGYMTTYSNYKRGTAQTTSRSIDGVETLTINRTVNDTGTIATQADGESKQTGYGYNGINQLMTLTTARTDDSNVAITRSFTNGVSEKIARGSYQETRLYDGFGTLSRTDWVDTGGTGAPAVFQKMDRDADGRVTKLYLPNSTTNFVRTDYDVLDRPTLVTQPDGSTINYEYLSDNLTRVTDERGFQTLYYYRSFGDPSEQELVHLRADRADTSGANSGVYQTTHIDRNRIGQVTAITQEGKIREYRYNSNFFLYEEDHPELGTIAYTHDSMGHVRSRRVGTSGTTVYALDRLYRVTGITYPDGVNVTSGYYKNDNLRFVTKGATRWDYNYDSNNNLTTETLTANGRGYGLTNSYDLLDALSSISYPSGLVVSYSPNAFGQTMQVSSALGVHASAISYYPNGQLAGFTSGNGYRTDLGQNSRLLPSTLVSSIAINGGLTTATNLNHLYDVAGNTTHIYDNRDTSQTRHMTYDGLNRLRTADGSWGSGVFTYDAKNNILSKQQGSQSLAYNYNSTSGRLDSVSGSYPRTYQYDVYGNVISNGTSPTYGVFGYDDASNMTRVGPSGSATINYAYDGNSRMAMEWWADGSLTRYSVYNRAGKLMYEDDTVNTEGTDYIYLGSQLLANRSRCTSSVDSDSDGISNCAEWRAGMNAQNASDANVDTDSDGLTNLQEMQMGANLYSADTDSDGVSDGWEARYGLNTLRADSNGDPDQDGLTNLQEYLQHTSPVDADTDNDGIPDGTDPNPTFNPATLVPIIQMLLE